MRVFVALGFSVLMTCASACTAQNTRVQNDVGFFCSVKGEKHLSPVMSSEAICDVFKVKIDAALKRKTIAINSVSETVRADWIMLDVRFLMSRTASAVVKQSTAGQQTNHPEIAVDVMDKVIGPSDVGTLASEVAKVLSAAKHPTY